MGLFSKKTDTPSAEQVELAAVRAELTDLKRRLDESEQARSALEGRLATLDATTTALSTAQRASGTEALAARVDGLAGRINAVDQIASQVGELTSKMNSQQQVAADLGQLAERLAANDQAVRTTTEQLAAVEQRVTAISVELANQINELGHDIDALASMPAAPGTPSTGGEVGDELLAELRTAQVRLANEQARYEIAFRQDLAALAEQVRRTPRS
jgi:chromosome segregation ATPase